MTVGTHKIAVQERDSMQTGHISKELFCDWQAGRMKQPEEERFLGHIGVCTFCAGQLGNWMEEGILEITVAEEPGNVQELTSVTECSNQSHHPLLSEPPGFAQDAPNGCTGGTSFERDVTEDAVGTIQFKGGACSDGIHILADGDCECSEYGL